MGQRYERSTHQQLNKHIFLIKSQVSDNYRSFNTFRKQATEHIGI